jgi:hypothetical protein
MAPPNTSAAVTAATTEDAETTADNASSQPGSTNLDSGPVQAYAKLEGDEFCYYIRTLQVTLGRKGSKNENVDIPLGTTKSVSRQHARLFYNFTTQRFEMMVFGKNGAFVNEHFVEKGVTVPLENRYGLEYDLPISYDFSSKICTLGPKFKSARYRSFSFFHGWISKSHHRLRVWAI